MLLDLRLPDGSGLDLLRRIGAASIGTAVVMLPGDLDRQTVQEALAAGAVGYVPKTEPREIIAGALGLVLAGGVYVPPVALQTAARTFDTRAATPEALGLTGLRGQRCCLGHGDLCALLRVRHRLGG